MKENNKPDIEIPCSGVVVAVDHKGVCTLIHWPEREGFVSPNFFDMIIGTDLDESGFESPSDFAGLYECTYQYRWEKGPYEYPDEGEWFFDIVGEPKVLWKPSSEPKKKHAFSFEEILRRWKESENE